MPIVGFTWYSLTDQVDWDTALREDNGRVNPLGLYDLSREIRPVGRAYQKLIADWRAVLHHCCCPKRVPAGSIGTASPIEGALAEMETRARAPHLQSRGRAGTIQQHGQLDRFGSFCRKDEQIIQVILRYDARGNPLRLKQMSIPFRAVSEKRCKYFEVVTLPNSVEKEKWKALFGGASASA